MTQPAISKPQDEPSAKDAAGGARRLGLLTKQKTMNRMLVALAPLAMAAVYFFGWRMIGVLAVVFIAGYLTELVTARQRGKAVSTAALVTCALYGLSLPPTTPMWIAAVGVVVGILFGKEVFGGFGKNPFNPAIVGRAFVYICFPVELTGRFVPAFSGWPGGLTRWSFETLKELPAQLSAAVGSVADAVTQATPLRASAVFDHQTSWQQMATGSIGGTFEAAGREHVLAAGSMGEGCAVLIVLAGIYLLWTKTASWRLMLGGLAGVVTANMLFRNVLGFDGAGDVPPLHFTLLSGTTLYVIVYMITEPVSAPKKRPAQLTYAFMIGSLIVVLRWRGIFAAAATFAILLGNLIGPLLDLAAGELATRKKARLALATAQPAADSPAAGEGPDD